jgi:ATP/ADP translocase
MKESLKVLLSSRYVRDLATLVVAYGISINLVEVTWKSKLKAQVIFLNYLLIFSDCLVPTVFYIE